MEQKHYWIWRNKCVELSTFSYYRFKNKRHWYKNTEGFVIELQHFFSYITRVISTFVDIASTLSNNTLPSDILEDGQTAAIKSNNFKNLTLMGGPENYCELLDQAFGLVRKLDRFFERTSPQNPDHSRLAN